MNSKIVEKYSVYYEKLDINKNLIFFESHNSIDLASNLFSLMSEIADNESFSNFELYVSCVPESKPHIEELLYSHGINDVVFVVRESDKYFELLASAKYLFTDVAYNPIYRKKKGQICVSTWHGTPLKTLGYTYYQDSYVVPNQKRGFCLADYFVCPNEYTWDCIRESYQLDNLFKGKVLFGGYPRNSIFFDKSLRRQLRKDLNIKNKKIAIYMPTWRGKVINVDHTQKNELLDILDELDNNVPKGYEIWVKFHRLLSEEIDFSTYKNIREFPTGYETYEIVHLSDALITDYSSIMFDYMNTGKKIVLFCYDKESYSKNRGVYFDIEDLPFPITRNVNELISELKNADLDYDKLRNIMCKYDNKDCTKNILNDIFHKTHNCKTANALSNKYMKSLLFVGDLSASKETDSLFEYMENNHEKKNFFITFMNHLFIKKPYKLLQFQNYNKVPFFMYDKKYFHFSEKEANVNIEINRMVKNGEIIPVSSWDIQESAYRRDSERFLYENTFYEFIRFAGLDIDSLKFLRIFTGKKIIYIHENMTQKAKDNKDFKIHLNRAIEVADEVHFANRDVFTKYCSLGKTNNSRIYIEDLY